MIENSPHQETIPFLLHILLLNPISAFWPVGSAQITCRDFPTRFPSYFLYETIILAK